MIQNESESLEYWNERFSRDENCVGWGSKEGSEWQIRKEQAIEFVLKDDKDVMCILDLCCGNSNLILKTIEKTEHNERLAYFGLDGAENQILFNKNLLKENKYSYPIIFQQKSLSQFIKEKDNLNGLFDVLILNDVLFHIIEDDLYENIIKTIFSLDSKYIILTFAESDEKIISDENGHFITRPFNRNIKGYKLIHEDYSRNLINQKICVFKKGD